MIKRIILWLISIYIKPAPDETKTIPEAETMTDQVVDIPAQVAAPAAEVVPVAPATDKFKPVTAPVDEVKAGVADFEAALSFIESGVAQLGEAAKDELKELAKKYL